MTTSTRIIGSLTIRAARHALTGLGILSAATVLGVAGATSASASQYASSALSPSQGTCSQAQYAGYQVRATGYATNQGAKFKLVRNGVVVANTPSRVNAWTVELRSSWGSFPGPGYYSVCAQNTGTANTNVTLQLFTDGEF